MGSGRGRSRWDQTNESSSKSEKFLTLFFFILLFITKRFCWSGHTERCGPSGKPHTDLCSRFRDSGSSQNRTLTCCVHCTSEICTTELQHWLTKKALLSGVGAELSGALSNPPPKELAAMNRAVKTRLIMGGFIPHPFDVLTKARHRRRDLRTPRSANG